MGNRAIVVFEDQKQESFSPLVYLHWNGGPESIYCFLDELDRRGVRADQDYECARFVAIVAEFFDKDGYNGLSLGVQQWCGKLEDYDQGDNGIYAVCRQGKTRRVRRFGDGWCSTPAEVERERRAAYKSDYMDSKEGIPSVFADKLPEKELV